MVWPFSKPKGTDSFHKFEPWMKDFLEQEAPLKPSKHDPLIPENQPKNQNINPARFSKYGDKYADLWAQYKTPEEIDAEYRSPSVAVNDVLASYKNRKALIGRAAMENCVFQQAALHDCYGGHGIKGKLKQFTGCSDEMRAFEDCFSQMQKLLHTMGYANDFYREAELDERIQMHADRLYREQVLKDKEMERRAARGEALHDEQSPINPDVALPQEKPSGDGQDTASA